MIQPGDKVRILVGTFKGHICTVHDVSPDSEWVRIQPGRTLLSYMIQEVEKL